MKVSKKCVRQQLDTVNELLGSAIPQGAKMKLCCMIEGLLMELNLYNGFNNIYWLEQGCDEWNGSEKDKEAFIIGPEGVANKPYHEDIHKYDDFVSDKQGEYARRYYCHNKISKREYV